MRVVGLVESISFVLLLFVAMPLKYLAGQPEAVRVVGTAHGALWILFVVALLLAALEQKWGVVTILAGLVASMVPLGPVYFDRWVTRKSGNQ
jgi:integral membrane protein